MTKLAGILFKWHEVSEKKWKVVLWSAVYFLTIYKAIFSSYKILQFSPDDCHPFKAETCNLVLDEYMLCWLNETFIVFQTPSIIVLISEFHNYINLFQWVSYPAKSAVLTTILKKIQVFCNMTPFRLVSLRLRVQETQGFFLKNMFWDISSGFPSIWRHIPEYVKSSLR
jgi:hypothetical protein